MRTLPLMALVAALLLPGCLVEEPLAADDASEPGPAAQLQGQQFEAEPEEAPAASEVAAAPPHGTPQRTDGPVTTGTDPNQVPGAWARQTITITNDAYGAALVDLDAAIAAGWIRIEPVEADHYEVVALLEARAATEAQAEQELARASLEHTDALDGDVLVLADQVKVREQDSPVPGAPGIVQLDLGGAMIRAELTLRVPAALPYDARASSASGDLSATGLRGPSFAFDSASGDVHAEGLNAGVLEVDTASGDVAVEASQAERLDVDTASGDVRADGIVAEVAEVSTASGDVRLDGAIATLEASTSSGDLDLDLAPQASGAYHLSSASGGIDLDLPAEGHGYRADASTASGDLDVDLADGRVVEEGERHVEAVTEGYDDAAVRTAIEASTSSGDIAIASA